MSQIEQTKADVLQILSVVLQKQPQDIDIDAPIESLSQDSIQLFEVILAFERSYDTKVDYEDLMKIETVTDIIAYIQKRDLIAITQPESLV